MLDKLRTINENLRRRFPDGDDPFRTMTRLLEECGELAEQVNYFEDSGVKRAKHGEPDRAKLAAVCPKVCMRLFHTRKTRSHTHLVVHT